MKTIRATYGRYQLVAGRMQGRWVARAFLAHARQRGSIVAEAEGTSNEGALAALRDILSAGEAQRCAERRFEDSLQFGIPAVEEYREALQVAVLSNQQWTMLHAHAQAGDRGLTATELAASAGYSSYEVANSIYGRAGKLIADAINLDAPQPRWREADLWTGVLARPGERRTEDGHFVWVMYPELREALRGLDPAMET